MGSNKGPAMTTDQIEVDANQENWFDAASQLLVALRGIVERE
jgi:hypothetical protein